MSYHLLMGPMCDHSWLELNLQNWMPPHVILVPGASILLSPILYIKMSTKKKRNYIFRYSLQYQILICLVLSPLVRTYMDLKPDPFINRDLNLL